MKIKLLICGILLLFALSSVGFAAGIDQQTVNVYGKLIEVNDKFLDVNVAPVIVDGSTLVPLRAISDALSLQLTWKSEEKSIILKSGEVIIKLQIDDKIAYVNNIPVMLSVSPKIIDSTTLVPLRFISENLGAIVNYKYYKSMITVSLSVEEKKLRKEFNDAQHLYESAFNKYNVAKAASDSSNSSDSYTVYGKITSESPFVIWGKSYPKDSKVSAQNQGYIIQDSNILIENPDENNIQFGTTYLGKHYYKGRTTGKGVLGQSVIIHVFGAPSNTNASIIAKTQKELNSAEKNSNESMSKLKQAKQKLVDYVVNTFDNQIKQKPNDITVLLGAVEHMLDLLHFTDDKSLMEKTNMYLDEAKKIDSNATLYHQLSVTEFMEPNDRINVYKAVAEYDPYVLLNFAASDNQLYEAGIALNEINKLDYSVIVLGKATNTKNTELRNNAKSVLDEVKSKINKMDQAKRDQERLIQEKELQELLKANEEIATKAEKVKYDQISAKYFLLLSSYKQNYTSIYISLFSNELRQMADSLEKTYVDPSKLIAKEIDQENFKYVSTGNLKSSMNYLEFSISYLTSGHTVDDSQRELNNAITDAKRAGYSE